MFTDTYRIADTDIVITSIHDEVHQLCKDYRHSDDEVDIKVETVQADIDFERTKSVPNAELDKYYPDSYLETLAVYRKIAERMPKYDTVLFHGSCVAVDGVGYLFTARSGTGKSTHARLWRELLGDRAVMINDDKPLIRVTGSGAWIYGTPWDGKHRLSSNTSVPLKAICLLGRAEQNSIERIGMKEAYPYLLESVYRPADPMNMKKTLSLVDTLASSVSLYRMGCNMDIDAARTAYEGMKG